MVDPTDKDTKHIKDRSTGTEGYTFKEKGKGKDNQLDVGNEKDQSTVVVWRSKDVPYFTHYPQEVLWPKGIPLGRKLWKCLTGCSVLRHMHLGLKMLKPG